MHHLFISNNHWCGWIYTNRKLWTFIQFCFYCVLPWRYWVTSRRYYPRYLNYKIIQIVCIIHNFCIFYQFCTSRNFSILVITITPSEKFHQSEPTTVWWTAVSRLISDLNVIYEWATLNYRIIKIVVAGSLFLNQVQSSHH